MKKIKALFSALLTASLLLGATSAIGNDSHLDSDLGTIVVYSGTFDPPHIGHVQTVTRAAEKLHASSVYIIPNVTSEHKSGISDYAARKQMSMIAFSRVPHAIIADPSIEKIFASEDMGGVLKTLHARFPKKKIELVMGVDSYPRFLSATENQPIPGVSVVVIERRALSHEQGSQNPGTPVTQMDLDIPDISSSQIRDQIQRGIVPNELDPRVLKFILEKHLYFKGPIQCQTLALKAEASAL